MRPRRTIKARERAARDAALLTRKIVKALNAAELPGLTFGVVFGPYEDRAGILVIASKGRSWAFRMEDARDLRIELPSGSLKTPV